MRVLKPTNKPTLAEQRKATEVFLDFKFKSVNLAIDLFTKLVAFFFTFLAVSLGFLFTQKLPIQYERILVVAIIATAFFYFIISCAFGWGTFAGLRQIKMALHHYDPVTFGQLQISRFVNRGILVGVLVAGSCVGILLIICSAVLSRLFCPLSIIFLCGP